MATPNYKGIVRLYEAAQNEGRGVGEANRVLRESIAEKDVDNRTFDFGRLFVECFGWDSFSACRNNAKMANEVMLEASGPVTTASFQAISGQLIFSLILEQYQSPEFVFSRTIPVRQCNTQFEKIAGINDIGDEVAVVYEGDEYPVAGPSERYRHRPVMQKRGFKVQLTREVLFFDKTGRLQQAASGGGKSMGQNREKRAVDCTIDENAGAASAVQGGHRYHYLGNSIATYGNSSGNHDWDNLAASNGLVDWTDLDAAEALLVAMTDPATGEPIIFNARHLVCDQSNKYTALRIRNATEINVVTPGFSTTGNPTETRVGNPFQNQFDVLTSPYVASRLATDTDWFYGDLTVAFEYCQAWPEEIKQLAGGTQLEFDRDIVQQYRFSEMGNYSTAEPRAMIENTA